MVLRLPSSARAATRTTPPGGLRRVLGTPRLLRAARVTANSTSSGSSSSSRGGGESASASASASSSSGGGGGAREPLTATTPPVSFAAGPALDKAARRFAAGVKAGLSPDEMTAMELAGGGASSIADLTEPQREYARQVRAKLEKRADELAREDAARRAREARNFEAGKLLYERGEYPRCVQALELAVEDAGGRGTQLGGEAALWLALGYQALRREEDCLGLYQWLEQNHPNKRLRKQAGDLRYILEAPKLELSPDERVTVPVISSADAWKAGGRRSTASSSLRKKGGGGGGGGEKKPWERDLAGVGILPDSWYVRVAWVAVIVGTGVYGNWVAGQQRAAGGGGGAVAVGAAVSVGGGRQQQQRQEQGQEQQAGLGVSSSSSSVLMARQSVAEAPALRG